LVGKFFGFAQNSFEKWQAVFLQSLPRNVPTNRKKGIKIQQRIVHALIVFKRVYKLKTLELKTFKINLISEGEFKKNE
jgi:hypothetical protein